MSEASEEWKDYKQDQKDRRSERLPIRVAAINSLRELGYTVKELTEFQFRINDTVDLYPIHNRWHDIKTGKRGGCAELRYFIIKHYPIAPLCLQEKK